MKKGLGKGLSSLKQEVDNLKPYDELAQDFYKDSVCSNRSIISVLRSKGGSGEGRAVNVISDSLISLDKSVLVMSQNTSNIIKKYAGNLAERSVSDDVFSHVFCEWGDFFNNELYKSYSSYDVSVFTRGTSSSGGVSYLKDMSNISELTFVSVNTDADESIAHAYRAATGLLSVDSPRINDIKMFCWFEIDQSNEDLPKYFYKIYSPSDFINLVESSDRGKLSYEEEAPGEDLVYILKNKLRVFDSVG